MKIGARACVRLKCSHLLESLIHPKADPRSVWRADGGSGPCSTPGRESVSANTHTPFLPLMCRDGRSSSVSVGLVFGLIWATSSASPHVQTLFPNNLRVPFFSPSEAEALHLRARTQSLAAHYEGNYSDYSDACSASTHPHPPTPPAPPGREGSFLSPESDVSRAH